MTKLGQSLYSPLVSSTESVPTNEQLGAWDWRAELVRQERDVMWLARKTGAHYRAAYHWANGERATPPGWLLAAWNVLGRPALS